MAGEAVVQGFSGGQDGWRGSGKDSQAVEIVGNLG